MVVGELELRGLHRRSMRRNGRRGQRAVADMTDVTRVDGLPVRHVTKSNAQVPFACGYAELRVQRLELWVLSLQRASRFAIARGQGNRGRGIQPRPVRSDRVRSG